MKEKILVIMCKYPEPGRVKTRLGREIGMNRATEICKRLLDDLLNSIRGLDCKIVIIDSQKSTLQAFRKLYPEVDIIHVPGDELRGPNSVLWGTFQLFCKKFQKVVMVNGDTVFLTKKIVMDSFSALDNFDIVIGPCRNKGIYLIGMKEPVDLFTVLPRGPNPKYYEQTINIIESMKLEYCIIEPLYDLDILEDIQEINWDLEPTWTATKECLQSNGLLS
jgi:hypothetical protein